MENFLYIRETKEIFVIMKKENEIFEVVGYLESVYPLEVNRNGEVKHNGRNVIGQVSTKGTNARRITYNFGLSYKTVQRSHLIWNHYNPKDHVKENEVIMFIDNKKSIDELFALDNLKKIVRVDMPNETNITTDVYRHEHDFVNAFYRFYTIDQLIDLVNELKDESLKLAYLAYKHDVSEMAISRARRKVKLRGYLIKL